MATASALPGLVTMEEYLGSSYEPDLEFVDGVLEEKCIGEREHSLLQMEIGAWFVNHREAWGVQVMSEFRTRTAEARIRLPDVCVVRQDGPKERVGVTAPLIVIEILSPADRLGRVMRRLDEFVAMGVKHVWVLDPSDRSAATYTAMGLKPASGTRLDVAGTEIYLDLERVFAVMD